MSLKSEKKHLYLRLARDALSTANREKHYAAIARSEMKYSDSDMKIAKRKGQIARMEDDRQESKICKEFNLYRLGVSHHYSNIAREFRKRAKAL